MHYYYLFASRHVVIKSQLLKILRGYLRNDTHKKLLIMVVSQFIYNFFLLEHFNFIFSNKQREMRRKNSLWFFCLSLTHSLTQSQAHLLKLRWNCIIFRRPRAVQCFCVASKHYQIVSHHHILSFNTCTQCNYCPCRYTNTHTHTHRK